MVFLGDKSPEGTMAKFPAGATSSKAPGTAGGSGSDGEPSSGGKRAAGLLSVARPWKYLGAGGPARAVSCVLSPPAAAKQRPIQPIQLLQLLG